MSFFMWRLFLFTATNFPMIMVSCQAGRACTGIENGQLAEGRFDGKIPLDPKGLT